MDKIDAADSRAPQSRPTIELRIDELILNGFGRPNAAHIGTALERELSRLISAGDLAQLTATSLQLDYLNAGSFSLEPNAHPNHIGRQLAQRVYGQLSRIQPTGLAHNPAEGATKGHV